jgi:hypothetical protein
MAFDAKTHVKMFPFYAIVGFYRPMTFLAENFFANVSLVVEQHVFSQVIGFAPGGRRPGVIVFVFLKNPWMPGDDIFVTVQAFFYRRQSGVPRVTYIGMAVLTLYVFHG